MSVHTHTHTHACPYTHTHTHMSVRTHTRNLNAAVGAYYDYYQPAYQPPEMSLVDDVTIGNGESIAPSTHFNKTWRVRNSGTVSLPVL